MHSSNVLNFRKSSYSGRGDNCIEVADTPGHSAVRDTQNRSAGHLMFPTPEWTALLTTLRTHQP
ncbi:DUF397 domain-containing protein [Nocardiopsis alba]|jgi:hypothetical protein|uniref:DUF397 domain-containing protein n=1 Tax=Nocardiopsis alba TaxID=53437 RepID=A0ABV5DW35_9ACTN